MSGTQTSIGAPVLVGQAPSQLPGVELPGGSKSPGPMSFLQSKQIGSRAGSPSLLILMKSARAGDVSVSVIAVSKRMLNRCCLIAILNKSFMNLHFISQRKHYDLHLICVWLAIHNYVPCEVLQLLCWNSGCDRQNTLPQN